MIMVEWHPEYETIEQAVYRAKEIIQILTEHQWLIEHNKFEEMLKADSKSKSKKIK